MTRNRFIFSDTYKCRWRECFVIWVARLAWRGLVRAFADQGDVGECIEEETQHYGF